jgi:hypothetical protein
MLFFFFFLTGYEEFKAAMKCRRVQICKNYMHARPSIKKEVNLLAGSGSGSGSGSVQS